MPKRWRACICFTVGSSPSSSILPARRPQQRRQHLDRGRLARAVRAEKSENLPLRHLEGDVLDGREIAKRFDQIAD